MFDRKALKAVFNHSKGFPRVINILCDHALLTAYSAGKRQITGNMVRESASDLKYEDSSLPIKPELSGKVAEVEKTSGTQNFVFYSLTALLILFIVALVLYRNNVPWIHKFAETIVQHIN